LQSELIVHQYGPTRHYSANTHKTISKHSANYVHIQTLYRTL